MSPVHYQRDYYETVVASTVAAASVRHSIHAHGFTNARTFTTLHSTSVGTLLAQAGFVLTLEFHIDVDAQTKAILATTNLYAVITFLFLGSENTAAPFESATRLN
ncbi:Aste57867_7982 [Aphanomyces stellatus]|uniref:Aste57867_7982 protein n=1 Tax=Aphanomyces stellatus TaxID=120398 RepID=A0A485KJ57_9STRA|nr:hypothetical protein As57867_007952 [Aphanomyces stellatus]VFT84875.1 Aste57867_7982 [Aphanomyces stellatus]